MHFVNQGFCFNFISFLLFSRVNNVCLVVFRISCGRCLGLSFLIKKTRALDELKNVFQRVLPAGKINIIFKTKCRLLNSRTIYHCVPAATGARYIGETCVHFRILGYLNFMGKSSGAGTPTAVTKHIRENKLVGKTIIVTT